MPLTTQAKVESHLGVSSTDAARVFRWVKVAEAYLRRLKGNAWYDAVSRVAPAPPGGAEVNPPSLTLTSPLAGDVSNPVLIAGTATDDAGIARIEYQWDGGVWRGIPLPDTAPDPAEVTFSHPVALPVTTDERDLVVRVTDTAGKTASVTRSIRVIGWDQRHGGFEDWAETTADDLAADSLDFRQAPPSQLVRELAERAESVLCLYYALPHLNLRLDAAGGILTTVWTDLGGGTKQQTSFAQFEGLDAFRRELMSQAHLLVDGDVRVTWSSTESGLIDAVGGFAGGGGALSYI